VLASSWAVAGPEENTIMDNTKSTMERVGIVLEIIYMTPKITVLFAACFF
jgi:hypothetical protein